MSCFRPFIRFEVPFKVRGYVSTPGKPFLDKIYPEYYVLLNADGSKRMAAKVHNGAVLLRVPRDVVPQDFAAEFHSSHTFDFVPCGKCEDCRLRLRRELTYRLVAEYDDYYNDHPEDSLHESVLFLTLTYDDDHLVWKKGLTPLDVHLGELYCIDRPSLVKEHIQTFMKDLRSWCDYHYPGLKLRFYVCGEYGPASLRPHYHMILYGLPDTVLREYGCRVWSVKDQLFESLKLNDIWGRGRVLYGIANFATMQYCAGYVLKKLTSQDAEFDEFLFYEALQDDPFLPDDEKEVVFREFRGQTKVARSPLMIEGTFHHGSRRPGLGRGYYERFKDQIMRDDAMTIVNGYGKPIRVKPSSYFDRLYDGENRVWDNVPSKVHLSKKSKRFKLATERIDTILSQKNITLKTYLEKKNYIVRNGFSKIKRTTL